MEQIILDGSQRGLENGKWRTYTDIMPSITAREYKEPRNVMEVIQIGNIAEEKNFRNPQTGRIYDVRNDVITVKCLENTQILTTYESVGRGFESLSPYQIEKAPEITCFRRLWCFFFMFLV